MKLGSIVAALLWSASADAQTTAPVNQAPDFQFALLKYNGDWNPRPHGLPRLAWEVRRRTSIAIELATAQVEPEDEALFGYPFVVWQGTQSFSPLSETAVGNLHHFVVSGGTLLI
ncbi:MAG: DUF4159 domain-containing protein, partial [Clostridia bacterium]|nr:DUF4159 domain-containing protein [Deltaproteobacteria bacterium]